MKGEKRYDQYPRLMAFFRAMSPRGRTLIREWQKTITEGFSGFVAAWPNEAKELGFNRREREAGAAALAAWLQVMREVNVEMLDPRPASWCCKAGMVAWPEPCPAHPVPQPGATRVRDGAGRVVTEVCLLDGSWAPLGSGGGSRADD